MNHVHHAPETCLPHCIEGVSEVDVDSIDLLSFFVGFMRDKIHFLHIDVDFDPACPRPAPVLTLLSVS